MYVEKRSRNIVDMSNVRKPPSLVDICIRTAIDNVRYLGDVGETDSHLLERILPHCTMDQLIHVEKSTKGRDLSPVTDKLWKNFYELQFGRASTNLVIERMKLKKVSFRWRQLYEGSLPVKWCPKLYLASTQVFRKRPLHSKSAEGKQSRQVQLCTKVPPSSKRSFFAGSGPGYNLSYVKSNIMKKAKIDLMNSQEVKNLAAMKKKAVQTHHRGTTITKSSGLCGKNSASSSKLAKPLDRRF
ncbi:hypothetical protein QUC31_003900 [Theobroma cacao]